MTPDTVVQALCGFPCATATWRQLRDRLKANGGDLDIGVAAALKAGRISQDGGLYVLRPKPMMVVEWWPKVPTEPKRVERPVLSLEPRYIEQRLAEIRQFERPVLSLKAQTA